MSHYIAQTTLGVVTILLPYSPSAGVTGVSHLPGTEQIGRG